MSTVLIINVLTGFMAAFVFIINNRSTSLSDMILGGIAVIFAHEIDSQLLKFVKVLSKNTDSTYTAIQAKSIMFYLFATILLACFAFGIIMVIIAT